MAGRNDEDGVSPGEKVSPSEPKPGPPLCSKDIAGKPCNLTETDLIHHRTEAREKGFDSDMFPDKEFHEFEGTEAAAPEPQPIDPPRRSEAEQRVEYLENWEDRMPETALEVKQALEIMKLEERVASKPGEPRLRYADIRKTMTILENTFAILREELKTLEAGEGVTKPGESKSSAGVSPVIGEQSEQADKFSTAQQERGISAETKEPGEPRPELEQAARKIVEDFGKPITRSYEEVLQILRETFGEGVTKPGEPHESTEYWRQRYLSCSADFKNLRIEHEALMAELKRLRLWVARVRQALVDFHLEMADEVRALDADQEKK